MVVQELGYQLSIETIQAKQLWNGRKAEKGNSFIPGLFDFHNTVEKHLSKVSQPLDQSVREPVKELETAIKALHALIAEKTRKIRFEVEDKAPSNLSMALKNMPRQVKSISFKSTVSRQAALLIAQFDELAIWDNFANSLRQDLDFKFTFQPGQVSRHFQKEIRTIFYKARNL